MKKNIIRLTQTYSNEQAPDMKTIAKPESFSFFIGLSLYSTVTTTQV